MRRQVTGALGAHDVADLVRECGLEIGPFRRSGRAVRARRALPEEAGSSLAASSTSGRGSDRRRGRGQRRASARLDPASWLVAGVRHAERRRLSRAGVPPGSTRHRLAVTGSSRRGQLAAGREVPPDRRLYADVLRRLRARLDPPPPPRRRGARRTAGRSATASARQCPPTATGPRGARDRIRWPADAGWQRTYGGGPGGRAPRGGRGRRHDREPRAARGRRRGGVARAVCAPSTNAAGPSSDRGDDIQVVGERLHDGCVPDGCGG